MESDLSSLELLFRLMLLQASTKESCLCCLRINYGSGWRALLKANFYPLLLALTAAALLVSLLPLFKSGRLIPTLLILALSLAAAGE